MPKAIELPVNILVIVAIAVIILLSLVVTWGIGWNPFSSFMSISSLKSQGCSNFSYNYQCGIRGATTSDIVLPKNNYDASTLLQLCQNYLNASDEASCKIICGCGSAFGGGGGGPGPGVACTSCDAVWTSGTCGGGGCPATQRQETRSGVPAGCTVCPDGLGLSRCVPDVTCSCSCNWVVIGSNCGCTRIGFGNGEINTCVCVPPTCGGTCTDVDALPPVPENGIRCMPNPARP